MCLICCGCGLEVGSVQAACQMVTFRLPYQLVLWLSGRVGRQITQRLVVRFSLHQDWKVN